MGCRSADTRTVHCRTASHLMGHALPIVAGSSVEREPDCNPDYLFPL
ncbi:MAG: hypothetical protein NTZ37_06860 [Methanoregula sp.]|nr:hypothetical protein [Methanoregula sp.]